MRAVFELIVCVFVCVCFFGGVGFTGKPAVNQPSNGSSFETHLPIGGFRSRIRMLGVSDGRRPVFPE